MITATTTTTMNSALKPVITSTGPQNTSVPAQINNKQMHSQNSSNSTTYGQQPLTTTATTTQQQQHMPQNLVNLPHNNNNNNPNVAHNQQLLPNPAHQTNHYSLNIPNAPQHYTNNTIIPASNHPVPNMNQNSGSSGYTAITQQQQQQKTATYPGGYQPNLGHPPNSIPPVTQSLPATQPQLSQQQQQQSSALNDIVDKPQSNGTNEVKSPQKSEPTSQQQQQENHIITTPKDEKTCITPPIDLVEKTTTTASVPEHKQNNEVVENDTDKTTDSMLSQSNNESIKVITDSAKTEPIEDTTTNNEIKQEINDKNEMEIDDSMRENIEENISENTTKTKEQKNSPVKQSPTPRTPTRKSRTPKSDNESPTKILKNDSKATTPTPPPPTTTAIQQKSPSGIGKSKRTRTQTQPYQSPLPEIEIITKISSTPKTKNNDEKLIVFYKNEFLAVRNSEGSFYICQAVQNIYKSSPKIRIRWLSQDKNDKTGEVYTPDFYDHTDFDCILTNLNLERVDKGKYRLPPEEKERTDSILKRSLAVEKGEVTSPSLTEEHPDGIDVSLYKEESQLKKRRGRKRKATSSLRSGRKSKTATAAATATAAVLTKSPDQSKVRKIVAKTKTNKRSTRKRNITARKPIPTNETKKLSTVTSTTTATTTTTTSRTDRLKRRSDNQNHNNKVSPIVDQKKARVLAKVARKGAISTNKNQESVKASKISSTSKAQKSAAKTTTKKGRKTKRSKK